MLHVIHNITILHNYLKQVSFTEEALCENVGAFVNALLLAKPAGLKKSKLLSLPVLILDSCVKIRLNLYCLALDQK